MAKPLEFSEVYQLLNALKEGDESKKDKLNSILNEFKDQGSAESFLHELGQNFLFIGVKELFNYTNSVDWQLIGKMTREEWDELAKKNNGELPLHLANAMIKYFMDDDLLTKISSKWKVSRGELEKHVRPMARYITEGLIDVLE